MDATIAAALIGAFATIAAAFIGRQWGIRKGLEKGQRHSILKFMDEQEKQLDRAMVAIRRQDHGSLQAIATAIVDNAQTWRRIQENFRELLNGRIDDLEGTLRPDRVSPQALENIIRALHEGYQVRRLAVETELGKSNI